MTIRPGFVRDLPSSDQEIDQLADSYLSEWSPELEEAPEASTTQQITLSPTVAQFVCSDADVAMLYSARGEGKSTAGVIRLLRIAHDNPLARPLKVAVIRDTWVNIERSTFDTLRQGQARGWWDVEFQAGQREAMLDGMVRLYFFGMERESDSVKFQGFEAGALWLEEPASAADLSSGIPASVFALGVSSLRQPGVRRPTAQITMNPPDRSHWTLELDEVLAEARHPHMRCEVFRIPTGENPHLPPGYRERMRLGLEAAQRPDLIRRLAEGNIGTVLVGVPVTPEFSDLHVAKAPIEIRLGWPTFRFWDFGLNPTCIHAQTTPMGHLHVIGCLVGVNMGVEELIQVHVIPWEARMNLRVVGPGGKPPQDRYGHVKTWSKGHLMTKFRDIGDPAGRQREQSSSERSAARTLENLLQTTFEPGPVPFPARRNAIRAVLTRNIGGRPMVQIDPECEPLIEALEGRWRYAKFPSGKTSPLPIKDIACVDEDTQILTLDGWRSHDQLSVGELVYGYDLRRDRLKSASLLGVHRFQNADALHFVGHALDMLVTPAHRCIARHRWAQGVRVVAAEDLDSADALLRTAPDEMQRKPWYSDDFIRSCAWVMTEGTYRLGGAIHVVQSVTANPAYCDELDALFSRLGGWRVHDRETHDTRGLKDGTIRLWRLAGEIADAIRSVMPDKYPTMTFIRRMTNAQKRLFLYESIRGDGTWHRVEGPIPPPVPFPRTREFFIRPTTPRVFQKSRAAADALQTLATLAGIRATLHRKAWHRDIPRGDGGPCGHDGWSVSITRQGRWTSVRKLGPSAVTIPTAWCPQTELGTWVARRNGHVFVTGNSHPGDSFGYGCAVLYPAAELTRRAPVGPPPVERRPGSWAGR